MAQLPDTMKAWTNTQVGKPRDVLKLNTAAPIRSSPRAGEVMIRVSHAAINPADYKVMADWIPFRLPATPGMDFVGEIVQVGRGVANASAHVRIGTIVAGGVPFIPIICGVGTLAEYLVLPAHAVVQKPPALEEAVAAGLLGIAGQTCAAILRSTQLRAGSRVLLNGASGGVGLVLLQVLCGMGVQVTGICSARNKALVRRLGAEEVVDYQAHDDLYGHLSSICNTSDRAAFDAIIDCVGNVELYYQSPRYLKPSGKCISIEGSSFLQLRSNYLPTIFGGMPRKYKSIMTFPSGSLAGEVVGWYEKGWIKEVPIDSIFDVEDAKQAFEKQITGRAVGKIIVKIR